MKFSRYCTSPNAAPSPARDAKLVPWDRGGLGWGEHLPETFPRVFTPSQPPPASRGRSKDQQTHGLSRLLKHHLGLSLLTIILSLVGINNNAHAQSSDNALYTPASIKNANGEEIFQHICQGCHMPDAKGATGAGTYPALTGNPKLASPQYMAAVILFGRHDMPSFETKPETHHSFFEDTKLSDDQIAEVINYVRTHFGNTYSNSITAAEVAAMHPQDASSTVKP
jgi:mono/diheme cytochrome c family protein